MCILNHHFTKDYFFSNWPDLDQILPDQSFDLPNGRPESPLIAELFFTRIESWLY